MTEVKTYWLGEEFENAGKKLRIGYRITKRVEIDGTKLRGIVYGDIVVAENGKEHVIELFGEGTNARIDMANEFKNRLDNLTNKIREKAISAAVRLETFMKFYQFDELLIL